MRKAFSPEFLYRAPLEISFFRKPGRRAYEAFPLEFLHLVRFGSIPAARFENEPFKGSGLTRARHFRLDSFTERLWKLAFSGDLGQRAYEAFPLEFLYLVRFGSLPAAPFENQHF